MSVRKICADERGRSGWPGCRASDRDCQRARWGWIVRARRGWLGWTGRLLRDWVCRYNEAGIAGLSNRPLPGRSPKLTEGQMAALKAVVLGLIPRWTRWCAGALSSGPRRTICSKSYGKAKLVLNQVLSTNDVCASDCMRRRMRGNFLSKPSFRSCP